MKFLNIMFLILIAFLLNGCLSSPFKKVTNPNTPIDRPFYTILPPPGDEWQYFTNDRGRGYDLFFGRRDSSPTHTLVATVKEIHSYAEFKDANDFLRYVELNSMMDADPRRFNLVEKRFEIKDNLGKFAAYKFATAEDRLAQNSNGKGNLLLKLLGLVVVHPQNESVILTIDYSERGAKGEIDPEFETKARQFLDGLKFK